MFDLDGTLVDSRRDIAEALNTALMAVSRKTLAFDAILPMIGDGARALVERALSAVAGGENAKPADADNAALIDHARELFEAAYAQKPCVHTTLMPGAEELLEAAKARDLFVALITNKPRVLTLLVLDGLAGAGGRSLSAWFPPSLVRAGGDGPMKPSPDGIHALCNRLVVSAEDAWMIGDGPQDVLAGRAAGTFTIAVPGIADRERVIAANPHLIVESLHSIAALLTTTSV